MKALRVDPRSDFLCKASCQQSWKKTILSREAETAKEKSEHAIRVSAGKALS
jgi:hypothetical protein